MRASIGGCVEKNTIHPRVPLIFSVASDGCRVCMANYKLLRDLAIRHAQAPYPEFPVRFSEPGLR